MEQRRKIVVTGAAGRIAGLILPALRQRYDLPLLDVRSISREGEQMVDVRIADLVDRDRTLYRRRRHLQGLSGGGFPGGDRK